MPWSTTRPKRIHYDSAHAKARKAAAAKHDPSDPCSICRHPLGPMGPGLHYDHSPDRASYRGFAHGRPCPWCRKRCNVVDGAKRGRARQNVSPLRW